jgi:Uma2 family endonuclease
MSPKGLEHEVLKTAMLDRWYRAAPDGFALVPEITFRLSEDTYLEPDVLIYPRASGIRGLSANNVLLVVEIADSSLRYDTGRKAALYAGFGIRELWVIDAVRLTTRVFREPTADMYRDAQDFGPADRFTPDRARTVRPAAGPTGSELKRKRNPPLTPASSASPHCAASDRRSRRSA